MSGAARRTLGFSWPVLVGLAALAAPRVVLHDLDLVPEGALVAALLAVVPPLCWVAVVLWRRPPRPFLTVLVIGAIYGVFLAVGHQLLWTEAFEGNEALAASPIPEVLMRAAAVVSSIVTGTAVGAITGAVAALLRRLAPGPGPGQGSGSGSTARRDEGTDPPRRIG